MIEDRTEHHRTDNHRTRHYRADRPVARRAARACACVFVVAVLGTCTTGLADLLAYQVVSSDGAALYLGYKQSGFGVARVGVPSGALEIFRQTVSPDSINGCALAMDPRDIEWPALYYTSGSPDRILHLDYLGLGTPEGDLTGSASDTTCLRLLVMGEVLKVYAATDTYLIGLPVWYVESFDLEGAGYYDRVFYLGLRSTLPDPPPDPVSSLFAIVAITRWGDDQVVLHEIGHYVESNLLYLDGYLYWVEQEPPAILRLKADGSETPTTLLTPTVAPYAVAVDPETGTLYWYEFDEVTPRRIMMAEPGETAGTVLISGLEEVDPNGFLFYRW